MSRNYDNWERLVGAVLRREKDRRLAYCESFSSSSSADLSSRFSFVGDVHESADLCSANIFFSRDVKAMEYIEIRKAIRSASTLRGGPGPGYSVYKGWIDENYVAAVKPGSGIAVAITVEKEGHEGLDWLEKKINLSQYRHPNLVIPIGYYADTDTKTLIFVNEFMAGGSLDRHLFSNLFRPQKPLGPLPWATRMRVAVGAARGLAFLHNLEVPVLYGVLKTGDILLDADFNAKLSDFGIAKDGFKYDTPEIEGPWGVINPIMVKYGLYAAPEFVNAEEEDSLSTKCDVYSFGVVLVELITGRRALDRNRAAGEHNLIDWAKPYLVNRRGLLRIMDTRLEGEYTRKEAYKVGQIALQCVSSNPTSRPRMAEVVAALEKPTRQKKQRRVITHHMVK